MSKPKPCPFCGSTEISTVGIPVKPNQSLSYGYYCKCTNCKSTGPMDKSIAEARYSWNMRENVERSAPVPTNYTDALQAAREGRAWLEAQRRKIDE